MRSMLAHRNHPDYVRLAWGRASRTIWVGDVIAVNVGKADRILGVEFPLGREYVEHDDWLELFKMEPRLKEAFPNVI